MNRPLFIFEIANNHNGSVEHGKRIIRAMREVADGFPQFSFAVKLQYRDIEYAIHPLYLGTDSRLVKRFRETALTWEQYRELREEIRACGFLAVCTPFDEPSVDKIVEHGYDILKVPSCYCDDWLLLEKIAASWAGPMIVSTGGVSLANLDRVVSFLKHRGKDFALLHCLAEYPLPSGRLEMNQIDLLRTRYGVEVGWSSHEYAGRPAGSDIGSFIAAAKGATIFERHVGLGKRNGYSVDPEGATGWITTVESALLVCGTSERYAPSPAELESLAALRRGAFAKCDIPEGASITRDMVFFAMPAQPGQIVANDVGKYVTFKAGAGVIAGGPILAANVTRVDTAAPILSIVRKVRALLDEAGVKPHGNAQLEISHHYGLERFEEFGAALITVVNGAVCKRIIVLLPEQTHPEQWHDRKHEVYVIMWGSVHVKLDGASRGGSRDDTIVIPRGVRHSMFSANGCVIEEVSTEYDPADSHYTDPAIEANPNRKTYVTYWGDVK